MDIYLVGGAVRDQLLGIPVHERDWVVVGSNPREMLELGYRPVGKDFPVFLHPETQEEYALARTERKTGAGHKGFAMDADETVTLTEDLMRRDLTINAIAQTPAGELIDPYHGQQDLEAKILRHVSPAFEEDPLRILRLARFAAKLPGFTVAPETLEMVRNMVARGDIDELTPERVTQELRKALHCAYPAVFFETLERFGATEMLWPELRTDDFTKLAEVSELTDDPSFRFGALIGRLDKPSIEAMAKRLRLPNDLIQLGTYVVSHYQRWLRLQKLSATEITAWLYELDSFRRPELFDLVCDFFTCLAEANEELSTNLTDRWAELFDDALNIGIQDIDPELKGPAIGQAILDMREQVIADKLDR